MTLSFSETTQSKIKNLIERLPDRRAACIPVLYLAQEEFGYISSDAIDLVAKTLELPPSRVYSVATFYTMLKKQKVGRYHIQICTNVSCQICGATNLLSAFEEKLGIKAGQTTNDGMFTLSEVECLAYCGSAPAVQVNDVIYELVSPDKVDPLLDKLKTESSINP